jgi:ribonuclease D
VNYLIPLAEALEVELEKKGRLDWVYEESEIISKVRPAPNDDHPLYLKFKGSGRLDPRGLALLEALLRFRMKMARKKDKPLFKVFGNESIMKIVQKKPLDPASFKKVRAFSARQMDMYGSATVEIVNRVLKMSADELPVYPQKRAPAVAAKVSQRVKALKTWREKKARALKVEPGLIFNNALVSVVAVKNPKQIKMLEEIAEMKNWQRKEFGSEIITLLKSLK